MRMGCPQAGQAVRAGTRVKSWVGKGRLRVRAISNPPLLGSILYWTPKRGVLAGLAIVEKNRAAGGGVDPPFALAIGPRLGMIGRVVLPRPRPGETPCLPSTAATSSPAPASPPAR